MALIYSTARMLFGALDKAGAASVGDGGEGALAGGSKGYAALELALELRGERRAEQGLRRALERLSLAALAAEAEAVHDAESREQPHAAAGEALRRGERPGQRQLEHEVRAAAGRGLRPGEFGPHRGLPALDEVARHAADHPGVRAQGGARALDLVRVAVVKGLNSATMPTALITGASFVQNRVFYCVFSQIEIK